jgi:hypothetical protein
MVDDIASDRYIQYHDVEEFIEYYDGLVRDSQDEDYSDEDRASFQELVDEYEPARIEELREMLEQSPQEDFIREDQWLDYATEMFDEICAPSIPEQYRAYIDYEKWASDLEVDYSTVEYDGHTYYHRG